MINSLKAEINAKEQRIKNLKAKLESSKGGEVVGGTQEPMLAKIADEINEIKEIVSGKKETEFDDFTPMENIESDSEEERIAQKVEQWKRLKAEIANEKKEIKSIQDTIISKKDKWRESLAYLKNNYTEDMEEKKQELMDEKTEIDIQIKAVNKKVEVNKRKVQKAKEMEAELKPYLNKKNQKPSLRKFLDFDEKGAQDTLFNRPQNFDDFESMGFSSDQEQ